MALFLVFMFSSSLMLQYYNLYIKIIILCCLVVKLYLCIKLRKWNSETELSQQQQTEFNASAKDEINVPIALSAFRDNI